LLRTEIRAPDGYSCCCRLIFLSGRTSLIEWETCTCSDRNDGPVDAAGGPAEGVVGP
jgi:hypothetical protein